MHSQGVEISFGVLTYLVQGDSNNTLETILRFFDNGVGTHKIVNNGEYDPQTLDSIAKLDNFCCKNREILGILSINPLIYIEVLTIQKLTCSPKQSFRLGQTYEFIYLILTNFADKH